MTLLGANTSRQAENQDWKMIGYHFSAQKRFFSHPHISQQNLKPIKRRIESEMELVIEGQSWRRWRSDTLDTDTEKIKNNNDRMRQWHEGKSKLEIERERLKEIKRQNTRCAYVRMNKNRRVSKWHGQETKAWAGTRQMTLAVETA